MSTANPPPAGGFRFFSRMTQQVDELAAMWATSVRTLPDGQLRSELEELRRRCGSDEIGPADLVAQIYTVETERRRGRR
jgi:hypothetical protein